jgi:hypothetical protein
MSFTWFVVVFFLSGAAMALWIDNRFPTFAPEDLRSALLRVVGGWAFVHLAMAAAGHLVSPFSPMTRISIILAVGFALVTIALLTAVWMFKVARGMMGGSLR